MTNYYIEKVIQGSQEVDLSQLKGVFEITDAGIFQIKDFANYFRRYNIFVTASNGLINSTSYNLIDLKITQNVAPHFISEPEA